MGAQLVAPQRQSDPCGRITSPCGRWAAAADANSANAKPPEGSAAFARRSRTGPIATAMGIARWISISAESVDLVADLHQGVAILFGKKPLLDIYIDENIYNICSLDIYIPELRGRTPRRRRMATHVAMPPRNGSGSRRHRAHSRERRRAARGSGTARALRMS